LDDQFRLAVVEDYDSPSYANLDYGITIAANIVTPVPEASTLTLLPVGFAAWAFWRRRSARHHPAV